MTKTYFINGEELSVENFKQAEGEVSFTFKGKNYKYTLVQRDGRELILDDGTRFKAAVSSPGREGDMMVMARGREAIGSTGARKLKKAGGHAAGLVSPMPGKIFKILKDVGSDVEKGETILILEAMKMEHAIRADKDGKVKKLFYKPGELVQGGVTLAEVE